MELSEGTLAVPLGHVARRLLIPLKQLKNRSQTLITFSSRSRVRTACSYLAVLILLAVACSPDVGNGSSSALPEALVTSDSTAVTFTSRSYQHTIFFMDPTGDPPTYVSWEFLNREMPDSVSRQARGWLGRAGAWSLFVEDPWVTGPSRAPWRVVVRPPIELVVGYGDRLREVHFQDGLRSLSLRLGDPVEEFQGPGDERYRLLRGTVQVSGQESSGLVLDATAAWWNEAPHPTEWALLSSGRQVQLLISGRFGTDIYQAWARLDSATFEWEDVTVTWDELRRFERASRDVPVRWSFASRNGVLTGTLEAVSSHFKAIAEEDDGPLAALGVYEVSGEVAIRGVRFPVHGFFRHFQR